MNLKDSISVLILFAIRISNGQCGELPDYGVSDFSCPDEIMRSSSSIPENVNALRPADIKVVMAMGDSLTVLMAWPGLTFHAGCAYDLEKHVTIPNILKKFNPNLLGCSNATGAKADELPFQARSLVSALNAHPKVNVAEDWKFLGIFIGTNDVCQFCVDQHTPDYFVSKITEALEILRSNLPRTIVSILSIPQLDVIRESVQKPGCRAAQSILNIALVIAIRQRGFFDMMKFDGKPLC
ncbi:hypothetical protein WR25_05240 isoform C [Diploscapter pachys]|uniref:SGNH hydrolase-type esterase domain-containing protein n=1 Tax=Diploscapter pachys TaxID=2018661 RepID=A0A2A2L8G8_9BILA|nr:hypothetical protein WR25_05240 isoform C [Diploscapter pachys]